MSNMEKINIAKILKDCPKGTKLYSCIHGEVEFCNIVTGSGFPIAVMTERDYASFTSDGHYLASPLGECVLFPSKDQRDWSKFQRPFKDGDIIFTLCNSGRAWISIFKKRGAFGLVETYADYAENGSDFYSGVALCNEKDIDIQRLATEEEKEELFKAIEFNGYRWNAVTKTLEKSIEKPKPIFKVGDKIQLKNGHSLDVNILKINAGCYTVKDFMGDLITIDFTHQDNYELVPDKFDITTLKPFESRVLIRNCKDQYWVPAFWGYKTKDCYVTTFGHSNYCIPYEGNEHLFKTKDDCSDYYKNR